MRRVGQLASPKAEMAPSEKATNRVASASFDTAIFPLNDGNVLANTAPFVGFALKLAQ